MKNISDEVTLTKDENGFKSLSGSTTNKKPLDRKTLLQHEADRFNQMRCYNKYFDCSICNNRGFTAKFDEEEMRVKFIPCECHNKKIICEQLDAIGVYEFSKRATFDNYKTNTEWQEKSKRIALRYVENYKEKWFFIGGNVGCGKTHLCTAILLSILNKEPRTTMNYFKWDDAFDELMNNDPYGATMESLKSCDVLYLDDFFRPVTNNAPKYLEIKKAKEILDYRYMNRKTTILSSELMLDQIVNIDQAIGSRIMEMSSGSRINYSQADDKAKRNVRIHPELIK